MGMVHWAQVIPFKGMKRIDGAPFYVTGSGITLINCTHFGGDSTVAWGLGVVLGSHKDSSANKRSRGLWGRYVRLVASF